MCILGIVESIMIIKDDNLCKMTSKTVAHRQILKPVYVLVWSCYTIAHREDNQVVETLCCAYKVMPMFKYKRKSTYLNPYQYFFKT